MLRGCAITMRSTSPSPGQQRLGHSFLKRRRKRNLGMQFLLATILCCSSVWGHAECGADHTSAEEMEHIESMLVSPTKTLRTSTLTYAIPVFFHIILQSDGQTQTTGQITDDDVQKTIRLLNEAYQDTPFYFYLKSSPNRVVNFLWYNFKCTKEEDNLFKIPLREGGSDALNVYVCDTSFTGFRGWATYPWRLSDDRFDPRHDGAVVSHRSVYGSEPEFLRHTLTHEVGHWLGLWHTYENGCRGNGDGVKDTPSHLESKTNCTIPNQDTCIDSEYSTYVNFDAGFDPRNNYMDTNNEECRSEFTPGQVRRMITMFQTFRLSNVTDPDYVPPTPSDQPSVAPTSTMEGNDQSFRSVCSMPGEACGDTTDCCTTVPLVCAEEVCVAVQKVEIDEEKDDVRLFDESEERGGVRRRGLKG